MPDSYKVPQNVDLEDKILGPFTLKQFFFILGGAFMVFVWTQMFWRIAPPLTIVLSLISTGITVAFVFVKPNDQPFTKFFFSFLWFTIKPNRRVWKRVPSLPEIKLSDSEEKKAPAPVEPSAEEVKGRLQRLAHLVDTRGWGGEDLDEADIVSSRVTSGDAKPKLNLDITDSDQPEDILAAEDEQRGSDRASAELERALKTNPKNRAAGSAGA